MQFFKQNKRLTWSNFFCFFSRFETICLWWSRSTIRSSSSCWSLFLVFSSLSKAMTFSSSFWLVPSMSFCSFLFTSSRHSIAPTSSSSFFLVSTSCITEKWLSCQHLDSARAFIAFLSGNLYASAPALVGLPVVSPGSCVPLLPPPAAPADCSSPHPADEYGCSGLASDGSPLEAVPTQTISNNCDSSSDHNDFI